MQQRRRLGSQPQCAPQHCSWRDKLNTPRWGRVDVVGPVGIEPTTRGLTCHFGFRRRYE